MPLGMMTSKAEMRSLATSSRASPRSKMSRTLPLRSFLMPGKSSCRIGSFAIGELLSPRSKCKVQSDFGSKAECSKEMRKACPRESDGLTERSLTSSIRASISRRRARDEFDLQRNARLRFAIQPDVHRIQARFGKLQLLDVHDEIEVTGNARRRATQRPPGFPWPA